MEVEDVLEIIKKNPGITHNQLHLRLGMSKASMRSRLKILKDNVEIIEFRHKNKVLYFPPSCKLIEGFIYNNELLPKLKLLDIDPTFIDKGALRYFAKARLLLSFKLKGDKIIGFRKKPADFTNILSGAELNSKFSSRDCEQELKVMFSPTISQLGLLNNKSGGNIKWK